MQTLQQLLKCTDLTFLRRQTCYFTIEIGSNSEEINQYQEFQEKVSRTLPIEYERPIVHLQVKKNYVNSSGSSCAIIGGMGPLSDALLVRQIVYRLQESNCTSYHIDLLSIPPPRNISQAFFGGLRYVYELRNFLHSKSFPHVFLASNTAHVNYQFFHWLSSSSSPIENLTKQVTERIAESLSPSETLILETITGHKNLLYEKQFAEKNLRFCSLPENDQTIIQGIIDTTKAGRNTEETSNTLAGYIESYKVDCVLLGCTELPIALGDEKMEYFRKKGINIVDTEKEFADVISRTIIRDQSLIR
eukprot:gene13574-14946_t